MVYFVQYYLNKLGEKMYNLLNEDGNEDDIKWLLSIVVKRILDKYHSQSRALFDFYVEG